MKKSTFKFLAIAMFFFMGTAVMAQVTMTPSDASAFDEITLTLNIAQTCPANALVHADSVMMHSGITLDGNAWSNVIEFNAEGVNGLSPKFEFIGPYVPKAITITPADATAWDTITITLNTRLSCPDSALFGADSVMMHSGLNINGNPWTNVIEFNGEGANGQKPKLTDNGDSTWSITFVPAEFYGIAEGDVVTQLNCVFNNGTWDVVGKDNIDGECADFNMPFGTDDIYLWAMTYIPADFYGIESGADVTAIDCVFNGGNWDVVGKAYSEEGECVDFKLMFNGVGIGEVGTVAKFKLFPNPVNNLLTIGDVIDTDKIEIHAVTGQLIKVIENVSTNEVTINTSDLKGGVYFISVHNNNAVRTAKFIKN